ncbi:hypothetical protein GH733_009531 [Mirounga leonina]|nr:hypothetical protein GH733_009531 [Mirounga leonina]
MSEKTEYRTAAGNAYALAFEMKSASTRLPNTVNERGKYRYSVLCNQVLKFIYSTSQQAGQKLEITYVRELPRVPEMMRSPVSNEELQGSTPEAAAQEVQWVSFADSDIVPPASTWVFSTLGIMHHNNQATENAKEEVKRILGLLDVHLKMRFFLVVECVTLADITVAFPNTNHWLLTCINQPQFRAVLGEVKLYEKMAQFVAIKFAESQPKKDTPWKEKGSQEEKPG